MVQQIFKSTFSCEPLFVLFEKYCEKINKYFIFTKLSFQLMVKNNEIEKLYEYLKPFYYASKIKYLERKQTYTTFMTVVRHICRFHDIGYSSKIKYIKSYYEIIYYIKKPDDLN